MNLRDLRYLIAVSEHKHFGHAADACFVSQPTLSGQIKKLEESLGVKVFERTNRSVEITPVGQRILVHARRAIEQAEMIEAVAKAHQDPLAGPLRLGVIPTLGPYVAPLLLVPLRRSYPQMRLILSEQVTETTLHLLRRHEIDVALIATPIDDPDLVARPLFDEPFWLAHPRDHVLYTADEVRATDIPDDELLLLDDGHCLSRQVMEVCSLHEGESGAFGDLRAASLETLIQMVGAGFGCTLVPALALRSSWTTDAGVIVRPLEDKDAFRRISLVSRASFPRPEAVNAVAEALLAQLPNTVKVIE
ncbi:MAG: LysR substrate-binding domain-containing protein [Gammaproteobacteria bacterium]